MEVLAVVTARGGSKGLPGKNLKICAGKPLVYWSLKAASDSRMVTKIIFSTDDNEMAEVAREFPRIETQMRPAEMAADDVGSWDVVDYVYRSELDKGYNYDMVCLVQGDIPLRTGYDIDKAITMLNNRPDAVSLTSSVESSWPHYCHTITEQGFKSYINPEIIGKYNRQEYPPMHVPSGAVYLTRTPLKETQAEVFSPEHTLVYVIDKANSVDVDNDFDLEVANYLMIMRGPDTRFDNIHTGKRCWVIGTGPSLKDITPAQWAEIDKDITIGVNNITAYHQTDYLLSADVEVPRVLESFGNNKAIKFVIEGPQRQFDFPCVRFGHTNMPTFKFTQGLYAQGSSTHAAVNLAIIMGCNPIVLMGADYNNSSHIIEQPGDNKQEPYFHAAAAMEGFNRLVPHAKCLDRAIVNGNLDSALDCFPKKSVAEILNNGQHL